MTAQPSERDREAATELAVHLLNQGFGNPMKPQRQSDGVDHLARFRAEAREEGALEWRASSDPLLHECLPDADTYPCGHARQSDREPLHCAPCVSLLARSALADNGTLREQLAAAERERDEAARQKDGAYSERNKLVAALSKLLPSVIAQHDPEDEEWEDDWRTIVFIDGPTGQLSWHLHDSEVEQFGHVTALDDVNPWDGHTTEEKYERLAALEVQPGAIPMPGPEEIPASVTERSKRLRPLLLAVAEGRDPAAELESARAALAAYKARWRAMRATVDSEGSMWSGSLRGGARAMMDDCERMHPAPDAEGGE